MIKYIITLENVNYGKTFFIRYNNIRVAAPCGGRSGVWLNTIFFSIRNVFRVRSHVEHQSPHELKRNLCIRDLRHVEH